MKNRFFPLFLIFLFLLAHPLQAEKGEKTKLSPEHKEWLETVVPIITAKEKEVFLNLKSDKERERFIRIFWKQRDPYPDTVENEFYQEYMARVSFADRNFGRESSRRGSQTERGFFYLLLGPPLERQFFTTSSDLVPLELWYYQGEQKYGLPPYFYLIFYQPQGIGEYRLYYPGIEGPEKLIVPSLYGKNLDRNSAYRLIRQISGELASASLSYLPGESETNTASFTSTTIISAARSLAERKFSDAYARTYLSYKDYVETDYTHNFIESNYVVKVLRNYSQYFVHYAIEPKKINFAYRDGRYAAVFQLLLRMEDREGNPVLQSEEEIPLLLTSEQYNAHKQQIFSIQDLLPVIPGSYRFFFLLKNKTSKDFTSFEKEIFIPEPGGGPLLSSLLLSHATRSQASSSAEFEPFTFGGVHYLVNTENNFIPEEEMVVYCQVYNLEQRGPFSDFGAVVELKTPDEGTVVYSQKKPLPEIYNRGNQGLEFSPISLRSVKPGYYEVEVSVVDKKGQVLLSEKEPFILLSRQYPVVPWVYARKHPLFPHPDHLFMLASQYFMTRNYNQAEQVLKKAIAMKDEPRSRLLLARTLYALGNYRGSIAVALPLYKATGEREAAKVIALDYYGLRNWASCLVYLEKLLEEAAELGVLNLAARCYLNLNLPEKALPMIQKSLELDPSQVSLRELKEKAEELLKNKLKKEE
ncbi:MAG: GWxTD domain-containing protein [Candidatus Aminicenantales bacterium]